MPYVGIVGGKTSPAIDRHHRLGATVFSKIAEQARARLGLSALRSLVRQQQVFTKVILLIWKQTQLICTFLAELVKLDVDRGLGK